MPYTTTDHCPTTTLDTTSKHPTLRCHFDLFFALILNRYTMKANPALTRDARNLFNESGAALPLVMIFSVIVLISTTIYMGAMFQYSKPYLTEPTKLQALFNARSAVWVTLDSLRNKKPDILLPLIKAGEPIPGDTGFGSVNLIKTLSSLDTTPMELTLFGTDTLGTASASLWPSGGYRLLKTTGVYKSIERHTEVLLGAKPPFRGDTLVYTEDPKKPLAMRCVRNMKIGKSIFVKDKRDTVLKQIVKRYTEELTYDSLTSLADLPLIIQKTEDIEKIPSTVNGPLLIDGTMWDFRWKANQTVRVLGDLQITGRVTIENVRFVVLGEVKILDKSKLKRVSIFSASRVFIGDEANFSGDLLCCDILTIYDRAVISNRSSLTTLGALLGTPTTPKKPKETPPETKGGKKETPKPPAGVIIADRVTVDAAVIALGMPGSIETDKNTVVKGILYAQTKIYHEGSLEGIARASIFESNTTNPTTENVINGCIKKLSTVGLYYFPCFLGVEAIISWKED